MKIKALKSFCGTVSMCIGEVRDCSDEAVVSDLIRAGYAEEVRGNALKEEVPAKPARKKAVIKNVGK